MILIAAAYHGRPRQLVGNFCPDTPQTSTSAGLIAPQIAQENTADACRALGETLPRAIGKDPRAMPVTGDARRQVEEFDAAEHQNLASIGGWNGWAPHGVYINNFASLPKGV